MSLNRKLPRVPVLKVKDTRITQKVDPCTVALTNLLNCWASNKEGAPQCKPLEQELKECMAGRRTTKPARSTINYHSNRLLSKVRPDPHD